MSDIPEDVMKRARLIATEQWLESWSKERLANAIARALMEERAAERERCATIVDAMQADEIREYSIDLQHAARAIRGQP